MNMWYCKIVILLLFSFCLNGQQYYYGVASKAVKFPRNANPPAFSDTIPWVKVALRSWGTAVNEPDWNDVDSPINSTGLKEANLTDSTGTATTYDIYLDTASDVSSRSIGVAYEGWPVEVAERVWGANATHRWAFSMRDLLPNTNYSFHFHAVGAMNNGDTIYAVVNGVKHTFGGIEGNTNTLYPVLTTSDATGRVNISVWGKDKSGISGFKFRAGVDTIPAPLSVPENFLVMSSENVESDISTIRYSSTELFDGDNPDEVSFPSDEKSVLTEEAIPGTGLTGQTVIIDLYGKVIIDSIRAFDMSGDPGAMRIYKGDRNIFEIDSVGTITFESFFEWKNSIIGDTCRYILLNNPTSNISGIGELEFYGTRLDSVPVVDYGLPNKKVHNVWGVTTHDYDRWPSCNDSMQNIFDINPFANARTYMEANKSFDQNGLLITPAGSDGSFDLTQVQKFQGRGGSLLLNSGDLSEFQNGYPSSIPHRYELPNYPYDSTLSWEQNRANMTNPQNWSGIRDYLIQIPQYLLEQNQGLDTVAIIQACNELDKVWRTKYHRLNPFQLAAMYSMLWDGHEGQYGQGIKDIAPNMKIAWMAQSYNNVGYMKMAKWWFEHNRSDSLFCADIICSNSYSNNREGQQHVSNAHAIPPEVEGNVWIDNIKKSYDFSRSIGKEYALTEFGADASGDVGNSNRVFVHDSIDQAWQTLLDTSSNHQEDYNNVFWPLYGDIILEYQANWDLRYMLEASMYTDFQTLYHIRDNFGSKEDPWTTRGFYSATGITYRGPDYQLPDPTVSDLEGDGKCSAMEKKPSAILLEEFYNELGEYRLTNREQVGDTITMTFEDDLGNTKQVQWTTDPSSKPVILP